MSSLAGLSGCGPSAPPPVAAAEPQQQAVTRQTAIQQAQRDAAFRHAEMQVARVEAQKHGDFWVVELTSMSGSGLRYTISAHDGSIRQTNTFQ